MDGTGRIISRVGNITMNKIIKFDLLKKFPTSEMLVKYKKNTYKYIIICIFFLNPC